MELNEFKDMVFELLNEADNMEIRDIETYDRDNIFQIMLQNGSVFEVQCRQICSGI